MNKNEKEIRIEAVGLHMQFGNHKVLNNIHFSIRTGEIFGLLGPSGAGKTTLINILTGQMKQTQGKAMILGTDSRELTSKIYAGIGMVLDNTGLYERLTCYDNLSMFAEIYHINKSAITSILQKVGLDGSQKTPVIRMSKGMKQRLVLARAIMHNPRILFLDEPTSGLDPTTAASIHKLINEEKEKGTTIFLTTHNMEEAAKLCDHVALLHQGEIVEYGNPEKVCRKYNHQNCICILLKNGKTIKLPNESGAAETISDYFRSDQVESIHSSEPNLETVFMELTGRGLEQ